MSLHCSPDIVTLFVYQVPTRVSCLGNPADRGAWGATYSLAGRKELDMTEQQRKERQKEIKAVEQFQT